MRTNRLAHICQHLQQTVILDGITTSSCGLDIACICRDDKFLTSLQSKLAVSCNRDDQASKLLPLGAALRISYIRSLGRQGDVCQQSRYSYTSTKSYTS